MTSTSRQRTVAFATTIGTATLVASIIGGDAVAGIAGIALLVLFFGGAEVARRRGSGVGAVISGDRDERTGRLYERAAARTAFATYVGLVGWIIYGIAAGQDTDGPGLAVVAFAALFYGNVAWLNRPDRLRMRGAAGAR